MWVGGYARRCMQGRGVTGRLGGYAQLLGHSLMQHWQAVTAGTAPGATTGPLVRCRCPATTRAHDSIDVPHPAGRAQRRSAGWVALAWTSCSTRLARTTKGVTWVGPAGRQGEGCWQAVDACGGGGAGSGGSRSEGQPPARAPPSVAQHASLAGLASAVHGMLAAPHACRAERQHSGSMCWLPPAGRTPRIPASA